MDFEANESAGVSRKISRRLSGSARCALVRIDRLSMQKKRGCIQPRKTTGFIQEHTVLGEHKPIVAKCDGSFMTA